MRVLNRFGNFSIILRALDLLIRRHLRHSGLLSHVLSAYLGRFKHVLRAPRLLLRLIVSRPELLVEHARLALGQRVIIRPQHRLPIDHDHPRFRLPSAPSRPQRLREHIRRYLVRPIRFPLSFRRRLAASRPDRRPRKSIARPPSLRLHRRVRPLSAITLRAHHPPALPRRPNSRLSANSRARCVERARREINPRARSRRRTGRSSRRVDASRRRVASRRARVEARARGVRAVRRASARRRGVVDVCRDDRAATGRTPRARCRGDFDRIRMWFYTTLWKRCL